MFLGHFAVAFAARKAAPAVSLGTLFAAAQPADLVWPVLLLAGVEQVAIHPGITVATPLDFQHYPYSHSLLALTGWGAAFGIVHGLVKGGGRRAFAVLTRVMELVPFAAAVFLHGRTTRARDATGRHALSALAAFLAIVYAANVWGLPPPSVPAVAWTCLSMWLLVAWGAWIDRHREAA